MVAGRVAGTGSEFTEATRRPNRRGNRDFADSPPSLYCRRQPDVDGLNVQCRPDGGDSEGNRTLEKTPPGRHGNGSRAARVASRSATSNAAYTYEDSFAESSVADLGETTKLTPTSAGTAAPLDYSVGQLSPSSGVAERSSRSIDRAARTNHRTSRSNDYTSMSNDHSSRSNDHTSRSNDHNSRLNNYTPMSNDHTPRSNDHNSRSNDYTSRSNDHTSRSNDPTSRSNDLTSKSSDHGAKSREYVAPSPLLTGEALHDPVVWTSRGPANSPTRVLHALPRLRNLDPDTAAAATTISDHFTSLTASVQTGSYARESSRV